MNIPGGGEKLSFTTSNKKDSGIKLLSRMKQKESTEAASKSELGGWVVGWLGGWVAGWLGG